MSRTAALLAFLLVVPGIAQAAVNISAGPTKNMACSAGVCTPTKKDSALNAGDLAAMLSTSDVTVKTSAGAVTIELTAPLSWAGAHTLTLDASLNVSIKAQMAVEGTGGLSVITNDGGTGGDLLLFPGGKIDFWDDAGSFSLNGQGYKLVRDIASLAAAAAANRFGAYAFAADYDAGPDGVYDSPPIPNFQGTFEGLGHTIAHLDVNSQSVPASLFGSTISAVLRDLNLADVYIRSDDEAGALAYETLNVAVINVTSSGSVHAGGHVAGGLIGYAAGSYGRVTRSSSSATVTGGVGTYVGGLLGESTSPISLSHATGNVFGRGRKSAAGGLVGFALAPIMQSYATGNVTTHAATDAGGLAGSVSAHARTLDCYATGTVEAGGASRLGGLLGSDAGAWIATSYSVSPVVYRTHAPNTPRVGGFIGKFASGNNTSDYWDTDTSGQSQACSGNCPGITGLSDAALKAGLPAGFDPAIWGQSASVNGGYPYLLANPPE